MIFSAGDIKNHKNKTRRGYLGPNRSGFMTYGRRNFPGNDVMRILCRMVKNECEWVIIDTDGCNWVQIHGVEGKTRQKESKMYAKDMFCNAWVGQNTHNVHTDNCCVQGRWAGGTNGK